MLYNQEQRQLIIWEQKDAVKTFWSMMLLLNLGSKLIRRDIHQRVSKALNINLSAETVLKNDESYLHNI